MSHTQRHDGSFMAGGRGVLFWGADVAVVVFRGNLSLIKQPKGNNPVTLCVLRLEVLRLEVKFQHTLYFSSLSVEDAEI